MSDRATHQTPSRDVLPAKPLEWTNGSKYHIKTTNDKYTIAATYSSRSKDYMAWDVSKKPSVLVGIIRCVKLDDTLAQAKAVAELKKDVAEYDAKYR